MKNKIKKKKNRNMVIGKFKISKLNFSLLLCSAITIILTLIFSIMMISRKIQAKQAETEEEGGDQIEVTTGENSSTVDVGNEAPTEETTKQAETLDFNVGNDADVANRANYLNCKVTLMNTYDTDKGHFVQYRVTISNIMKTDVKTWGLAFEFNNNIKLVDKWNGVYEENGKTIKVVPVNNTSYIAAGKSVDIGFIVECKAGSYPKSYSVYLDDKSQTIKLSAPSNNNDNQQTTTKKEETSTTKKQTATTTTKAPTTTEEETTTPKKEDIITTKPDEDDNKEKPTTKPDDKEQTTDKDGKLVTEKEA